MEHLAIEFHDSTVHALSWAGGDLSLSMKVYVCSFGEGPVRDVRRGWFQTAELRVAEARIAERHAGDGLWILDGAATIGGQAFGNLLPLPCASAGPVELTFTGAEGTLRIAGSGLRVALTGEPGKVEAFDP